MVSDTQEKKYLSTSQAADKLGVSRVAIFKMIKTGKIPAHKVGRNYVIAAQDIVDYSPDVLTASKKQKIEEGVRRVVDEYGEVLKMLGKE